MANEGKFTDRRPEISVAGKKSNIFDFSEIMNHISFAEEAEAVISTQPKLPKQEYPPHRSTNSNLNTGFYTQVQQLLSSPKKICFQHLKEELKEPRELGKALDQVPNLPVGINPETTTFGKPSCKLVGDIKSTVGDVMFPKKPPLLENELGLIFYKRSHNHYLPGQRRDLLYDVPKNVVYGKSEPYDKTGKETKQSLQWFVQTSECGTSKRLAKFKERSSVPFGDASSPNKNILIVGKDHSFGIKGITDNEGLRESLRSGPIAKQKLFVGELLSYIYALRNKLKKRTPPFPFFELLANFKLLDKGGCGCLTLQTVFNVCDSFGLSFDRSSYEMVLKKIEIIHRDKNDKVNYISFCNLLDYTKPLPLLSKVEDLPFALNFYETTYQALTNNNLELNDYKLVASAGVPTLRTDREPPRDGICKAETSFLLDENGIDSCIRPSIFTSYGLHPRDFLELKTKDYIRGLWKRVGVSIPDDLFELMWEKALTREENNAEKNMVCIESFRNILDEIISAKLTEMQEA